MNLVRSLLILQSLAGSTAFSRSGNGHGLSRQSLQLDHFRRRRRAHRTNGGTVVSMMDLDLSSVFLSVAGPLVLESVGREATLPPISTMRMLPTQTLSTAARAITSTDPEVKAEVCTNMAHVGLDLVAFTSPAKILLRFSAVIGRVFAIMSDYLPDQAMKPEEVVFQLLMLSVSTTLFFKSVRPALAAASIMDTTSFRDRRAYQVMFRKFGLSWLQFKMLTAMAAEWIEVSPNGEILSHGDDDGSEYIYLLHEGEAEVKMNGNTIQCVDRNVDRHGVCFLGDMEFAQKLQKDANAKNGSPATAGADPITGTPLSHQSDLVAGPSGATLLRINTSELLELMNDDEQIASSVRSIVFAGMQEKLGALLENTVQLQTNVTTDTQGKVAAAVA